MTPVLGDTRRSKKRLWSEGLSIEAVAINPILLDLVADDALSGIEQLRCSLTAAARGFQCIHNDVTFKSLNRRFERETRHGTRSFGGLQRRRQVMSVNNVGLTNQHRALDDVFQFTNISGPMITGKHVYRRS